MSEADKNQIRTARLQAQAEKNLKRAKVQAAAATKKAAAAEKVAAGAAQRKAAGPAKGAAAKGAAAKGAAAKALPGAGPPKGAANALSVAGSSKGAATVEAFHVKATRVRPALTMEDLMICPEGMTRRELRSSTAWQVKAAEYNYENGYVCRPGHEYNYATGLTSCTLPTVVPEPPTAPFTELRDFFRQNWPPGAVGCPLGSTRVLAYCLPCWQTCDTFDANAQLYSSLIVDKGHYSLAREHWPGFAGLADSVMAAIAVDCSMDFVPEFHSWHGLKRGAESVIATSCEPHTDSETPETNGVVITVITMLDSDGSDPSSRMQLLGAAPYVLPSSAGDTVWYMAGAFHESLAAIRLSADEHIRSVFFLQEKVFSHLLNLLTGSPPNWLTS